MSNPDYARAEIGMRIRRERTLWNLTQEEFSNMLGISTNYLGQIERGTRSLSRKMEDRICELFHLSHEEFHQNLYGRPWIDTVAESGTIFHDLSEDDLVRLLRSCSHEELQLCGHILRSTLHYLRNSHPHRTIVVEEEPPKMEIRPLTDKGHQPPVSQSLPIRKAKKKDAGSETEVPAVMEVAAQPYLNPDQELKIYR